RAMCRAGQRFEISCRASALLRAFGCDRFLPRATARLLGSALPTSSIRFRGRKTAGRDIKLPLQRADHATERLRGAKQQRLVIAGPVFRHSNSFSGQVPLIPRLSKARATLFRRWIARARAAMYPLEMFEGVGEK